MFYIRASGKKVEMNLLTSLLVHLFFLTCTQSCFSCVMFTFESLLALLFCCMKAEQQPDRSSEPDCT